MLKLSLEKVSVNPNTPAQQKLMEIQRLQQRRIEERKLNPMTAYLVAYKDYSVYGVGWD